MTDKPTPGNAATVDPRDEAITTEVAYRMQSLWSPEMATATNTAAMLAREQGQAEVIEWLNDRSQRALVVDGLVFEARLRFGFGPHDARKR